MLPQSQTYTGLHPKARKIESKIKNKVSSNRIYSHTATVNNESVNSQMAAMKTLASKLVDAVQNEHTITSLRRRLQVRGF